MEIYFNNSFGNISVSEQEFLLQRLSECSYDPNKTTGSQKFPFVEAQGTDATWIKKEGKVMSISTNGKDRNCKDRFIAHYDPTTDRMYISHFLPDHTSSKGSRKNDMYAKDGVSGHIMDKINQHQAALDSGQIPDGFGFTNAQTTLNAGRTAEFIHQQIDVNEIFKNNEHIRQKCYDLHGEYHNAKSPDDLEALKKMCLDPETGFLPNTVEGKQTILKYAETDSEFKKFLEDAYTEYEKIHPLKTEAEVKAEAEARRNQSNRDRLNSVHANREDITNEWRLIDSQNPSKGYVRTISQQYQARQMMDKLKVLDIECEYDPQTKSIRITDPQSIDKFNTFKGDGGNPGGGDPDGKDPNGGKTSNGESVPDKSTSTLLGTPKSSTLSQSSWQDIDANDSSKGIQKIVKNKTEARQIMAVYQKAGIKCTYNEQTKSLQVTDSQSVAKIRELEARGTATDVDNIHSINGNGRKPHVPGQRVRPNSGNKSNGHAVRGRTAARKVFR